MITGPSSASKKEGERPSYRSVDEDGLRKRPCGPNGSTTARPQSPTLPADVHGTAIGPSLGKASGPHIGRSTRTDCGSLRVALRAHQERDRRVLGHQEPAGGGKGKETPESGILGHRSRYFVIFGRQCRSHPSMSCSTYN